jgi:hypothetical protein
MTIATLYNSFKAKIMNGSIDLDTDTIKVALCSASYVPDKDLHDFFDDITNEITGSTGYTAGGVAITNKAVTQDNTDDEGVFDGDDAVWTGATFTFRYAIIYKDTGVAGTSPLIGYIDFETNQVSTSGTVTIPWLAEGIINLA